MNKKRDLLFDILTWFLIIICVCSLWGLGFLTGLKVREIDSNTPNIVLNEKKANDNDLEYFTPQQSTIFCVFTTSSTTTYPFQNVFAVTYNTYCNLDLDTTTFYGLSGYFNVCLSNSQSYNYSTSGSYSFTFNANNYHFFDFQIDYQLPLSNFISISILPYVSSIDRDEMEITLEIYINDDYYYEYYYYYPLPIAFNVYQFFDLNVMTELVNKDILDNYTLGYDRGYYDGKLDGYDEGYYDRDAEYQATDSAFEMVWQFISNAFSSVFNVLDIQLFAGIKLFHILAIPLIISVLYFVIKILAK